MRPHYLWYIYNAGYDFQNKICFIYQFSVDLLFGALMQAARGTGKPKEN
jgi:hypothetical protein